MRPKFDPMGFLHSRPSRPSAAPARAAPVPVVPDALPFPVSTPTLATRVVPHACRSLVCSSQRDLASRRTVFSRKSYGSADKVRVQNNNNMIHNITCIHYI